MAPAPSGRRLGFVAVVAASALVLSACVTTLASLGGAPSLPAPGTSNAGSDSCSVSPAGVSFYGNLAYGYDNVLGENLYLDAYLPQGLTAAAPAVVMVHGSGGTKCQVQGAAVYFAQHGIAAFSIDYPQPTSTQPTYLEAANDTRLAVQWVRTYATTFNANPQGIGLWGGSFGAMLAVTAAYEARVSDPAAQVRAVVGWSGGYDFITDYYRDGTYEPQMTQNAENYVGCSNLTDATCLSDVVAAEPISHVAHGDPPTLLVTSTDYGTPGQCEIVNPQNSVELANDLHAHGVPVQLQTTSACGHATGYSGAQVDPPGTGTVIENTVEYLLAHLNGQPAPSVAPTPLPPPLSGPSVVTPASTCTVGAPSGVSYQPNVAYGTDLSNPVYLDVYAPTSSSGPLPAVVLVHGGGFVGGDKCDVVKEAEALATNGFVVFVPNYPLATSAQPTFPNPVYDIMNSVSWVRAHAATYNVNAASIGLWGGSSGANVALSAALAAPLVDAGASVKAVVSWSGSADLFELAGEYGQTGTSPPTTSSTWPTYLGCSTDWAESWDPAANACLGTVQQASPAQLLDPYGATSASPPAVLMVTSTDFTGQGTCETVPPRQATEVQAWGGVLGVSVQVDTNALCASGFGYFSTAFGSTVSFLTNSLG